MTYVVYINDESRKKNIYAHVVCNHIKAMSETDLVDQDAELNFSNTNNININAFSNYSDGYKQRLNKSNINFRLTL